MAQFDWSPSLREIFLQKSSDELTFSKNEGQARFQQPVLLSAAAAGCECACDW